MKFIVLDSESDDLAANASKIHVLSWTDDGCIFHDTNDYREMRKVLTQKDTMFVCHNAIMHDLPLFNRILGLNLSYKNFVDSLSLSWYINFSRPKHGIDSFGPDYGLEKPKVDDWENLSYYDYAHRCREDVRINWHLWQDLYASMMKLYDNDETEVIRFIHYLGFKMDCYREAEENGVYLDVGMAQKYHDELFQLKEDKTEALAGAMPPVKKYKEVSKPAKMEKIDGSLTKKAEEWYDLLKRNKLPINREEPVKVLVSEEKGNPSSDPQLKDWLFSLGWKPKTFKYSKNKNTGEEKRIPQVRKDGELCDSVKDLIEKDPAVEILDGLTVISHRLSVFKSFLSNHKEGMLTARVKGLTNTLRFKHADPLVNLPGVDKPWGKEIRGVLIPPPGCKWCGSDMVSLEDTTKRHYMKPLDPDYVEEMSQPGFDPHLNLAMFAGKVTQEQINQKGC